MIKISKFNLIVIDTFLPLILFWFLLVITFTISIYYGILVLVIYTLEVAYIEGRLQKNIIKNPPDLKVNLATSQNLTKDIILQYMIIFWPLTSLVVLVKRFKNA